MRSSCSRSRVSLDRTMGTRVMQVIGSGGYPHPKVNRGGSSRPVLHDQAGNKLKVPKITGYQNAAMIEDDRRDSKVHLTYIRFQRPECLISCDRASGHGENRPTCKYGNCVAKPLVDSRKIVSVAYLAKEIVPACKLHLDSDDRYRQLL